jgi:hypothetical protein
MTRKRSKALCALAVLVLFGASSMMFVLAADEQSIISSGLPTADKINLQELSAQGNRRNRHVEVADFHFGKTFVDTTDLIQFNEVYVPMFANGSRRTERIFVSCS